MSLPPSLKIAMTPFPHSVEISATLRTAQQLMEKHGVHHLPVTDKRALVGVISNQDILAALAAHAEQGRADEPSVKDAYVGDAYVVDLDEPLDNVLLTMSERHIGSAIVTRRGKLAGVFTSADACRSFGIYLRQNFPHSDGGDAA